MLKQIFEIISLIFLSMIFIFIITPIGLILQIYKNFNERKGSTVESYRIKSLSPPKENIEKMY